MKFDKETIFAFAVCLLIMIAWRPFSDWMGWTSSAEEESTVQTVAAPAPAPLKTAPADQKKITVFKTPAVAVMRSPVVLANEDVKVTLNVNSGEISRIELLHYKHDSLEGNVVVACRPDAVGAFGIRGPEWKSVVTDVKNSAKSCAVTKLVRNGQGEFSLIQKFELADKGYAIHCSYSVVNGKNPLTLTGVSIAGCELLPWSIIAGDKIKVEAHRLDYLTPNGDFDDVKATEKDEKFFRGTAQTVCWAAVDNKYFCSILTGNAPFTLSRHRCYLQIKNGEDPVPAIAVGALLPQLTLAPGQTASFGEFRMYNGPKIIENLKAFAPQAEKVRELAWGPLDYLARFLLWILEFFNSIFHSYGWSIVALTLLVRLVFYPITARGNESMKKMQKVQPMFKELREKYKDDPQLLNQKMSELYRKEGVNPFAGCLPILLQIPIFFALYQMLYGAIELRHESFLWCRNLAAADTVANIPLFSWDLPVNPLVIVMTVLMVIQQHMTPMAMDSAQKKMMLLMPVVMLIFLYDLPSGLTLYWTVSNLFSIFQLWLQKRRGQKTDAAVTAK